MHRLQEVRRLLCALNVVDIVAVTAQWLWLTQPTAEYMLFFDGMYHSFIVLCEKNFWRKCRTL